MADGEPMRKVGRGGAGNFYNQAAVDDASKQNQDLEAQHLPSPVETPIFIAPNSSASHLRTGRGGAGNFVGASELVISGGSSAAGISKGAVDKAKEKPAEKIGVGDGAVFRGHSGRGGVGNWRQMKEESQQEQDEKRRGKLTERIIVEVDAGLRAPPRVYDAKTKRDDE